MTQTAKDKFREEAGKWNTVFRNNTRRLQFMECDWCDATVTVKLDPALSGTQVIGEFNAGSHTITINPDIYNPYLYNENDERWLYGHELGHYAGLDHPLNCSDSEQTFMSYALTPGHGTPDPTCADEYAVVRDTALLDSGEPGCRVGIDCTPLLVAFKGGPLRLSAPDVWFTFGAIGDWYNWTLAGDETAGWLVLDRDGDGAISSGAELFGNMSPRSWDMKGPMAIDGFDALQYFDTAEGGGNFDFRITSEDSVFDRLSVWIDLDHNGVSSPAELHSLPSLGIHEISLIFKTEQRSDRWGNRLRYRSSFTWIDDGGKVHAGDLFDVFFGKQ